MKADRSGPARSVSDRDQPPHPRYVVWELTLRCDLACRHCGSRAGKPRNDELSLAEALEVVAQLAAMGTREITFIGGEAYLYHHWAEVIRAAADAGIRCAITTGGRRLTADMALRMRDMGVQAVSCSIDGLEPTHDRLRGVAGSHRAACEGLRHIAAAGMEPFANTQFNRLNLPEVEPLAALLLDHGMKAWQVQITGPMGRAADRPEWLLQPYDMLDLIPRLGAQAALLAARGSRIFAANNLGYFGPWELALRSGTVFQGCTAGRFILGIEADGAIKGCPSLPSEPYVGGNVREAPIAEIWERQELSFTRQRDLTELWGFCGDCYYREVCQGGCSWTSHTLLGRRGNMPYCYHRAETLAAAGLRERVEQVEVAKGSPFDFGRFRLVEEEI